MTPDMFRDLYAYTFWADRRVWNCVERLTEEQFTHEVGFSHGSVRDQCIHTMAVESWWLEFLRTGRVNFLDRDDYPTRAAVRAKWDAIERDVLAYLATITEADLNRDVRPNVWEGDEQPIKAWQALLQVANHSTDHRAQTLATIHMLGGQGVEQEYLDYLFDQQRKSSATLQA